MKKYSTLLVLLVLAFCGCAKEIHVPPAPSLLVIVSDETGGRLSGAVVLLYKEYADWFNMENHVDAGVADDNGEVLFEDLKENVYYFDASYDDCYWNYPQGVYCTESPLKTGYRTKVRITLHEEGDDIN